MGPSRRSTSVAAEKQKGSSVIKRRIHRAAPWARVEPLEVRELMSTVAGRHVFYNRSAFDGNAVAANAQDDAAIAADKRALLPGQAASFVNYTGYTRGINGVMVDIAGLPASGVIGANDFGLRAGTTADPSTWPAAPAPTAVTVRRGAGVGGSDRVTLVFADGAITQKWLQVTVLASARTALAAPDVFYFGNLPGETGDNASAAAVNAIDLAGIRQNLNRTAPVNSPFDLDHSGRVNAIDLAAARQRMNRSLVLLNAPALEGVVDVYVDTNRSGTFEAGELAGENVDLGDVPQGGEGVLLRLVNSGGAPVTLDGDFVLEERQDAPFGPGFSIGLAPGAPANVQIIVTEVERTLPDGTVLRDKVVRFAEPADASRPKVLRPGETIDLQITGNVIGAAAGSGAPTRRSRRIKFTGRVVTQPF